MKLFKKISALFKQGPPLITNEQFESMTLRQKAFYKFTDEQWNALTKDQKKRIFFARHKFKGENDA